MKEKKKENQKAYISVAGNSIINAEIINALDDLFTICPPGIIRKSLTDIFLSYLSTTDATDYKPEIREIATDYYCLIKFLETAEIYEKKKTT